MKQSSKQLVLSLIEELEKGIALINQIDERIYTAKPDDTGSIGSHFRHNLDFVTNFLKGVGSLEINYCLRERRIEVEQDREFAVNAFEKTVSGNRELELETLNETVRVKSEVDDSLWTTSSIARELEFVHSHTVHHYALVAAKMRALGVELPREFGVAPSTLKYWNSLKTKTKAV